MRQQFYRALIFIISMLYFAALQSLCNPTHANDSYGTGGWTLQTTTESWDSLIYRIFNVSSATEKKDVSQPNSSSNIFSMRKFEHNKPKSVNISEIFYYNENVANYPDLSKLEHLLKKYEHYFDKNLLDTKTLMGPDADKYEHLCDNQIKEITLAKEVLNSENEKVLLVNSDKYVQKIIVEACGKFENSPCGNYLKNFHEGYEPMCKQNYISRQMVVLKQSPDKPGEYQVVEDEIPVPACCECVLKNKSL